MKKQNAPKKPAYTKLVQVYKCDEAGENCVPVCLLPQADSPLEFAKQIVAQLYANRQDAVVIDAGENEGTEGGELILIELDEADENGCATIDNYTTVLPEDVEPL